MSARAILTLFCLASVAAASSPADATAAALADAARYRPIDGRKFQRYLWLPPGVDWKAWGKALDFWANSLSREAELAPLVHVRHDLLRLDLRNYRMPASVWEKLADVEPYFHAKVKVAGKEVAAHAPWLDKGTVESLAALTRSGCPIVRGDWWLVQTSQQVDRKGTGYFDFLQVKNRKDFEALTGLDRKLAERLQKEVRAVVARSGVALNNRQIIRFQTITGGYWMTLDADKNVGKSNAVRNLEGFRHVAEEIYGFGSNGLLYVFAGDNNGVRQDSVPDNIASNHGAPGNDRRIHPWGCFTCHTEGIRPINDWARKVYQGKPVGLGAVDYEQLLRLRRLYLSDLERWVRRDQSDYAETLMKLTGLKPPEMARLFGRLHASYQEADVDLKTLARWGGYSEEHARKSLQYVLKHAPPLDPLLAGLIAEKPEPLRVEHAEEVFPLFMTHMRGFLPAGGVR